MNVTNIAKRNVWKAIALPLLCSLFANGVAAQNDSLRNIVDEVVWVVGDEAILKSDIEVTRIQAAMEGVHWSGDPDCAVPEQIAVQKLFLHQAVIDSVDKDVTENDIASEVEGRIDYMVEQIGSMEKLEEYRKQSMSQIRQSMHDDLRDQLLIQRMKQKLLQAFSLRWS